ncbi:MAG: helix-turn-helix transcriptional regulator [Methylophilus sp.]|nr:helix-turn-helix transcriptional regulator [Methylophilus sp.]
MSPFAEYFHHLRINHGFKQVELANLMGYEQTYISAVELDKKGPPNEEFIQRLVDVFSLSDEESKELFRRAKASNRKLLLVGSDLKTDAYWLVDDLRDRLSSLSNLQIAAIRSIISIQDAKYEQTRTSLQDIRKRTNQEVTM